MEYYGKVCFYFVCLSTGGGSQVKIWGGGGPTPQVKVLVKVWWPHFWMDVIWNNKNKWLIDMLIFVL